jgi:O-antigen/teichoic acid export membrane protein
MAAQTRAGGDLKASYLRGLSLMSAVQWPTLIMLALLADPVVRILLGQQWGETAPLVRMISLATMTLAPAFLTFPVLVATGRIRDTLLSSLISLPPSILIVIGATTLGLWQVAASMFVAAPLQMFVALLFVRRAIGLSWGEFFGALRKSALMTMGAAALPGLVLLMSSNGFALGLGEAALAVLGGAVGWLAALLIVDHPLKQELLAVWRMIWAAANSRWLVKNKPAE